MAMFGRGGQDDSWAFDPQFLRAAEAAGVSPEDLKKAYLLLGVTPRDDLAKMKRTVRKLLMATHSDLTGDYSEKSGRRLTELMDAWDLVRQVHPSLEGMQYVAGTALDERYVLRFPENPLSVKITEAARLVDWGKAAVPLTMYLEWQQGERWDRFIELNFAFPAVLRAAEEVFAGDANLDGLLLHERTPVWQEILRAVAWETLAQMVEQSAIARYQRTHPDLVAEYGTGIDRMEVAARLSDLTMRHANASYFSIPAMKLDRQRAEQAERDRVERVLLPKSDDPFERLVSQTAVQYLSLLLGEDPLRWNSQRFYWKFGNLVDYVRRCEPVLDEGFKLARTIHEDLEHPLPWAREIRGNPRAQSEIARAAVFRSAADGLHLGLSGTNDQHNGLGRLLYEISEECISAAIEDREPRWKAPFLPSSNWYTQVATENVTERSDAGNQAPPLWRQLIGDYTPRRPGGASGHLALEAPFRDRPAGRGVRGARRRSSTGVGRSGPADPPTVPTPTPSPEPTWAPESGTPARGEPAARPAFPEEEVQQQAYRRAIEVILEAAGRFPGVDNRLYLRDVGTPEPLRQVPDDVGGVQAASLAAGVTPMAVVNTTGTFVPPPSVKDVPFAGRRPGAGGRVPPPATGEHEKAPDPGAADVPPTPRRPTRPAGDHRSPGSSFSA